MVGGEKEDEKREKKKVVKVIVVFFSFSLPFSLSPRKQGWKKEVMRVRED